jgi:oxygen-independent coproporphyrinogen-3 oxidase
MAGLYIHIPFCKQACSYCDFYFSTRKQLLAPFVDALIAELHTYRNTPYAQQTFTTLYFGGGTPSLLSEHQLEDIIDTVNDVFKTDFAEVTIEMNPDNVTLKYLRSLLRLGINRVSMGVQSFDSDLLTFMHRAHSREEALNALEAIEKTGFPSYTADLIYGNPGQTVETLKNDIQTLLSFQPPHISAYSLTIEPNTRLGKQVDLGRIKPPEDEFVARHFDVVYDELQKAGIYQYEVSNFAKPGKEALHNSNYWSHKNYLGFGPSAHSFWWKEKSAERWSNPPDLKQYLREQSSDASKEKELLNLPTLAEERILLGLRTTSGLKTDQLQDVYNYTLNDNQKEWLRTQVSHGTMVWENGKIRCTPKGLKISDLIIVDLLTKQ